MEFKFKDVVYSNIETSKTEKKIIDLNTAKRHVIMINDIDTKQNTYQASSVLKTKELIKYPVNSIALFCSEYVPQHFPKAKYVKYIFTINGKDYEIEPINSNKAGKKLIKYSTIVSDSNSTVNIKESIKSAYLTIQINTPNNTESPLISNIKILYGKGEA